VEQKKLIEIMVELNSQTYNLEAIYQNKLSALVELKQSLLQKAFSGELTAEGDKLMDEAVA
jgi:type I restriction enzyme S subunit